MIKLVSKSLAFSRINHLQAESQIKQTFFTRYSCLHYSFRMLLTQKAELKNFFRIIYYDFEDRYSF